MQIDQNHCPLQGKTIVLTRAQEQQSQAIDLLNGLGANVLEFPTLIIGPPDNWEPLDNALRELENFEWLVFSSANGVNAVEKRLHQQGKSLKNLPKGLKIAVVGRKTAERLKKLGSIADFIPPSYVAESLIETFPISKNRQRILLPRVQSGGRTILTEAFTQAGMNVTEVPAYESSCPEKIPHETILAIEQNKVDAITFTSGKTVKHAAYLLNRYFGQGWKDKLNRIKFISIGPQTSLSCKRYLQRYDREAHPHDIEGLIAATIKTFATSY